MSDRKKINSDVEFVRYLKKNGSEDLKKCFQCATCTVTCDLSPRENPFPRKQMIKAVWGMKEELVADPDIWLCHNCGDCNLQCPRQARPGDMLSSLRSWVYENYATPSFMGKALSYPKYLPLLLLVPMILIAALVLVDHNFSFDSMFAIKGEALAYADFLSHGALEMFFIAGNIIIFALAFMGFKRYWNAMEEHNKRKKEMDFIPAAIKVTKDFMFHKKFAQCATNSTRYYSHMYIFYGFLGTMFATAVVVLGAFHIVELPYPMGLSHWVKIIGIVSGVLLVLGTALLLIRRFTNNPLENKNSYKDWYFLWSVWAVAFTGLLTVGLRFTNITEIAYPVYYIHLVTVFNLLWYMPYSKFAHMIYRFLGLTYLQMHGRDSKEDKFIEELGKKLEQPELEQAGESEPKQVTA